MTTRPFFLLLAPVLIAAVGCVEAKKSSNPLSPTVAGPIPGVAITAPTPIEPGQGVRIAVEHQPITLALQNSETTGVRPLTYSFEIATDINFTNRVFTREGVQPGGDGRTTLRLPDALATGRSYYWRGRAQDGANTGPYSFPVLFHIFTPIVIGVPTPRSPSGNIATQAPPFVIGNAPRSGPAGPITYTIELAADAAFGNILAVWIVSEQPGETRLETPSILPPGRQLFWRARAAEATTGGGWSQALAFTTPTPAPPPSTGGGGGGSCAGTAGTSPLATLQNLRPCYPTPMSHEQKGEMLNKAAWFHRAEGYGLHKKDGGNRCPQPKSGISISCDILVHGPTGAVYDTLFNEDHEAEPTWIYKGPINTMSNFVAAQQP